MLQQRILFLLPLALLVFSRPAGAVQSAELYRTAPLTFGKFEARVRFAAGDGVISSFFLWKDGSEQSTVYWNELDFEKLGANCDLQTNTIYGLPQGTHEDEGYGLVGLCDSYHTYAYEWTPEYIAWSVDGTEVRRDTGTDATAYAENAAEGMQFRFNVWPGNANFGGNFSDSILPVYQFIAWARYSAYTPGAGDDGSDFTLSWQEEFESLPAGWATGSWESPLNKSTHNADNVIFVDGVAVLALTADDATGFSGTVPQDSSAPAGGGSGGVGATDSGGGSSESAGGTTPASSGGSGPIVVTEREGEGCSLSNSPHSASRSRSLVFSLTVGFAGAMAWRRRKARKHTEPAA